MRYLMNEGFYGCGASSITDLFLEYKSITNPAKSDFEISFFWGYYGIPQLYYHYVQCKDNREYADRDFLHEAKRCARFGRKMNYEKYFNGHFLEYTEEYLNRVRGDFYIMRYPQLAYSGLNAFQLFIFRAVNRVVHYYNKYITSKQTDVSEITVQCFRKKIPFYYTDINERDFILFTREYFDKLFREISDNNNMVMLDGFCYRQQFELIHKVFDDYRIILVNRDPRDIFLSLKYVWKNDNIPVDDIEKYCKWYRYTRTDYSIPDGLHILSIYFEDLIYHYDETVDKIEKHCGLNPTDHVYKGKNLRIERSIHNTRLWERYPQEKKNIEFIETNLYEWIYKDYNS